MVKGVWFFIPKLYVKRFSTFHWSCWLLFSKKYCVFWKKSTIKVFINFGFVTSFEEVITLCCSDTFMARELYSDFAIQNTFMSTVILVNEVSEVLQRHYPLSDILLASLSIFAQLPTSRSNIFATKALLAFWVMSN